MIAACKQGQLDIVRFFMESGAGVDVACLDDHWPILAAAESGHVEVIRFLVGEGADIDRADDTGATALYLASREGFLPLVCILEPT